MSETLYRKYRPATFGDVTDQQHIKTTLQNQLKQGTVAHAYLFAGPRGVGKTTLARILAKAVNCEKLKDGEPCGKCAGCLAVSENKTMDVFEIDAASNTGVDSVRENIIEGVRFAPSQLKMKVYIIDEVHMLSTSAFNALLKTLEEPPAHALFILATTELHKVPETIISRCQRFDFHRLSIDDITDRLKWIAKEEGIKVDDDVLDAIARLSEGCLRDAESLFGQILAIADGKKVTMAEASLVIPVTNIALVISFLEAVSRKQSSEAVAIIGKAVEEGTRISALEDEILEALRWTLLAFLGSSAPNKSIDNDSAKRLRAIADELGSSGLQHLIKLLLEYRIAFRNERIPQLPLELLAVQSSGTSDVGAIRELPKAPPQMPPTPSKPIPTSESKAPATPPPTIEPAVRPASSSNLTVTIDQIKGKWDECVATLSKDSGTLPVLLQGVELISLDGSMLRLGTKVSFLADKLNEPKNRNAVSDILLKTFNEPIGIMVEVIQVDQDELVSELIGEFGGKIV